MSNEKKQNNNSLDKKPQFNISGDVLMDQFIAISTIFKTLKKGDRKKLKLDETFSRNEITLNIVCHEPLADDDQNIFFGVLAICSDGNKGAILSSLNKNKKLIELRNGMFSGQDNDSELIVFECYLSELLRTCGLHDGGTQYKAIRENLKRLASVTMHIISPYEEFSAKLIQYHIYDKMNSGDAKVRICINPRSAKAILYRSSSFAYLSMIDHIKFGKATDRLVHAYISAWVGQGETCESSLDKLCSHIYSNFQNLNKSTKATYKTNVKNSLLHINEVLESWNICITGRGEYCKVRLSREGVTARLDRTKDLIFPFLK